MCVAAAAMATYATYATMAAAAVTAYGAYESGQSQAAAANYQAQVAKNNQTIASQNAQYMVEKGNQELAAKQEQTAQTIGMQRAAIGANGLQMDNGSPLRLQGDAAQLGELDAMTIRNNAARAAYGYRVQGINYANQASMDMSTAQNAVDAGYLNSFSSILGGASSVGNQWAKYQTAYGAKYNPF